MKTSIATVSISGNLREKLVAIAEAGFDGIEIFEQDFIADTGSPREVGNLIRDHGLEITLFQPFRDFEGLPEPFRAKAFDRAERKFDVMQELGTDTVLFCSSCHPKALGGIDRAADDLAELGERAAKRGIKVGYEALAWGKHVSDHRDAWEIVRRANHPNIGLILDSFHSLSRKIDPDTIRSIPGDKIFFVQLADAPLIDMDLLYWSRHFRNMPGEGDLPVTDFMRAVVAAGYEGPISLEIFNDQFRGGDTRLLAQDGYRSLIALMDDVKTQEPEIATDIPAIPARVKPTGVSFVEFATRGLEAEHLAQTLGSLGFAKTGQHRNKAVSVWQQGDIRFVLNEERSGYAASAWAARGTTVCDIGLGVSSASDAITRAKALGAQTFAQPLGPNELDIPAIRGLSGSVLHFIDEVSGLSEVWETEFESTGADTKGAGLKQVDHLAQTMSYADMLSWSLFYTTLFDINKTPMVDVIDPDGLIRSQALSSPDNALRITLNGADSHRTLAGDLLNSTFGAPLQHIALTSEDIFATARQLVDNGFKALPMSANYYDDIASRFTLPDEVLADMKALNILYDEDENGAFFQIYSRDFAGGVFFEILQRVDGYGGYGAPNAPFRIAAQKRMNPRKGLPRA